MSTPSEQPSGSPYSPPPQGPGGYGSPVPPQQNPYAQDPPAAPQGPPQGPPVSPPGQPVPSAYGPGVPGQAPPGYPVAGPGVPPAPPGAVPGAAPTAPPGAGGAGRRGNAGRAVLWTVVGAVVASAAWAGGVLLLRGGSDADLRGYHVVGDLCDSADFSPFGPDFKPSSSHTAYTSKGDALDSMSCSQSMEGDGGTSSLSAYTYVQFDLHKKTDPAAEFTDTWKGYTQHKDEKYEVAPVSGLGDEAYVITADSLSSASGERYATVAVRDGWMTYSVNWTQFTSFSSDSSSDSQPSVDKVTQWLKASAKGTLAKLRN